jgi:SAM-dependent methyltransferase
MGKVLMDPLYEAVHKILRGTREPLLDIGCGMGVLAFYLREHGWAPPCTCVDVDLSKIVLARRLQHQWPGLVEFHAVDVVRGLPDHHGSVTLLDVLHYLPQDAQDPVLASAASRVSADGVLIIRNAMSGSTRRLGITKVTDWLGRWSRWMHTRPRHYPDPDSICATLAAHGLHGTFAPLWGRTPFHNWLGIFRRSQLSVISNR